MMLPHPFMFNDQIPSVACKNTFREDMSNKVDENQNTQSANVLQLGFNISVSGDPGTDFQIVLDDNKEGTAQSLSQNQLQSSDILQIKDSSTQPPKHEIENIRLPYGVKSAEAAGAIPKQNRHTKRNSVAEEAVQVKENENPVHKESSIIKEIKSTMENFEKFSDHIKEIPRLKSCPIATSTPFSNKKNSKSEASLIYPEHRTRRFAHLYDFPLRKDYFRGSVKPLPPDLFLKPLPGENLYKRGFGTRYFDLEPYKQYGSIDSLNKTSTVSGKSKIDDTDFSNEQPPGILKKSESENGDRQSTSSADSVKDIKIYQSGGILIMQNFKESMDGAEKKEISDFSAKLIENCNKLKEEISAGFPNVEEKFFIGDSSEESKNSGKIVQFDLSQFENKKSKSSDSNILKDDSSSTKLESSESTSDFVKNKDSSPQGTSQSQDFPSFSTQENDSVISNQPGTSPTYNTSEKKLEWDSGADIGYLNLDLSKENLSTIERIVLKGLSSDGLSEKKVVYEKKPEQPKTNRSKFILERIPSELVPEDIVEANKKVETENKVKSNSEDDKHESKQITVEKKQETGQTRHLEEISTGKVSKDENQTNEIPLNRDQGLKKSIQKKEKAVELTDKSVNVNTLFKDAQYQVRIEDFRQIESLSKYESSKLSPKVKKLKKKRVSNQKKILTAPLKEKIDSIIDIARCSSRSKDTVSSDMGIPKKVHRKLEAKPEVELSREVEEIIIDQRFKIKQNVTVGRDVVKETSTTGTTEVGDSRTETKTKSRPISGSSSSITTVLPNSEGKREGEKKKNAESTKDQKIQTTDSLLKVDSVGIQAFASLKSSECQIQTREKNQSSEVLKVPKGEAVNTSSKNIQAFGLNSSLPRQLAHPRDTQPVEIQNTKSTQFFGGPINSLPNYHSNLVIKPAESCGHMQKAKKILSTEIIRLKEENEKNIMGNEDLSKNLEPKTRSRTSDLENKENLITENLTNSKKSQRTTGNNLKVYEISGGSRESSKNAKRSDSKVQARTETMSTGNSECFGVSDDVSSNILTSEMLREHGGSIDRNIIQEKYFLSQLVELEKREMRSKSTSMEKLEEKNQMRSVSVGCQYSPPSKKSTGKLEHHEKKEKQKKRSRKVESSEKYESCQNFAEELSGTSNQATGDSLPSSNQTANGWLTASHESNRDKENGIGRARSFEYLPGHVYENRGNTSEEVSSDAEQNLILCTSSGSSDLQAGKKLSSDGLKDSEGRTTVVLENSTESSHDSGPVKILSENLTQLNLVVSKLWEKDAQIQSVTQSLLVNLWNGGSGDCTKDLGSTMTPKTGEFDKEDTPISYGNKTGSGDMSLTKKFTGPVTKAKENEVSIGCQTEVKTPESEPEKIQEERKALEKRISQEKESQIKWIENEIYHLNLLRGLLEKQNHSSQRKKKHVLPSSPKKLPEEEEKYQKSIFAEVHHRPVTPVYGCTISFSDSQPPEEIPPAEGNNYQSPLLSSTPSPPPSAGENGNPLASSDSVKYGMAVSLTTGCNSLRRMIVLPVGVQVSLKDKRLTSLRYQRNFSDANTQCPCTARENFPSTSIQTDAVVTCCLCQQENCVCLELSQKSQDSQFFSNRSSNKTFEAGVSFAQNQRNDDEMIDNKTVSCSSDFGAPEIIKSPSSEKRYNNETSGKEFVVGPCKCENCPGRVPSNSRTAIANEPYQSSIYVTCAKSSEEVRSCIKLLPQNISGSPCHVIKILGAKCCMAESGSGSGKEKRVPPKQTENQYSQTTDVLVMAKNQDNLPESGKRSMNTLRQQDVDITRETRPQNKCLCQNKRPGSAPRQNKISVEAQTVSGPCNCYSRKKKEKERPKSEDHPRQYFLRIEETEVDELSEPADRKGSLEVITVTVPVKKSMKPKVYGKESKQSNLSEPCSVDSLNACKCCEKCLSRLCEKLSQQYENQGNVEYRKRPEFIKKPLSQRPTDTLTEAEDMLNIPSSLLMDQGRGKNDFLYSEEYMDSTQESLDRPTRDAPKNPNRYSPNNYPDQIKSNSFYDHQPGPYIENNYSRRANEPCDYDSQDRVRGDSNHNYRTQKYRGSERNSRDYYNYDKREYMTQSELLREKEKKKKNHQPTLQEYLEKNRPDFYNSAEERRKVIADRAKERSQRHQDNVETLMKMHKNEEENEQPTDGTEEDIHDDGNATTDGETIPEALRSCGEISRSEEKRRISNKQNRSRHLFKKVTARSPQRSY